MLDKELLAILADGRFHSGEALGRSLGMTRASIWKRVKRLQNYGVLLEQIRGKGYRLQHGIEWLDSDSITSFLEEPLELEIHDSLSSTNDRGLALAQEGMETPLAILAECQTQGRGRLGRVWQSPVGHNLYMTLIWTFDQGARLQGLSLMVGLLLAEVLSASGLQNVGVKWPNDIHVRRQKLGGILVELAGNLELSPRVVVGIGVNGWLGDALANDINQPATDWLTETGNRLDRNQLAGRLLAALQKALPVFAQKGFAAFHERWQGFDLCAGQSIWLLQGKKRQAALAEGVNEDGGLIVRSDAGRQVVYGGEVGIRWQ